VTDHRRKGRRTYGLINTDQVRGDDGQDTVPEPVGSGGKTNTSRSDGDREDFTDNDPSSGTPGGGEEEDVDTDQSDLTLDSVGVGSVGDTNDGTDELADEHTDCIVS
jgi:hypothetical protein